jgi:hypothetical protein
MMFLIVNETVGTENRIEDGREMEGKGIGRWCGHGIRSQPTACHFPIAGLGTSGRLFLV